MPFGIQANSLSLIKRNLAFAGNIVTNKLTRCFDRNSNDVEQCNDNGSRSGRHASLCLGAALFVASAGKASDASRAQETVSRSNDGAHGGQQRF